jgi:hypothetical protein
MGYEDPQGLLKRGIFEKMVNAKVDQVIQAGLMQLQMQAQQAQQVQQAPQEQPPGPIPGGEGFNPNAGGMAPAQAWPGMTREGMQAIEGTAPPVAAVGG